MQNPKRGIADQSISSITVSAFCVISVEAGIGRFCSSIPSSRFSSSVGVERYSGKMVAVNSLFGIFEFISLGPDEVRSEVSSLGQRRSAIVISDASNTGGSAA